MLSAGVVSDQASAAGVGSVPTPVTESDADFFLYEPLMAAFTFADATGIDADSGTVTQFDSKAMRKVGINEDVVLVVENEHSTQGAAVTIIGRMLLKLH